MIIHYSRKSKPSGRRLSRELYRAGYRGRPINFGYGVSSDAINRPEAIALAVNKRHALLALEEAGVPIPNLSTDFPCVGRPDNHRAGKRFYLCRNQAELNRAIRKGATHFLEYIEGGREFRVHIAFGKSIKLAEKIGGGNYHRGAYFAYPDFPHKLSLRRVAKRAVGALGLDFGAVDIIYKNHRYYVLEVNTAPCLTTASDTLDRYVRALMEESWDI